MIWAADGILSHTLRNPKISLNSKSKVFNNCILSIIGLETISLACRGANKLRTTQRAIERLMLGINLWDDIRNEDKVENVIRRPWSGLGQDTFFDMTTIGGPDQWKQKLHKRSVGQSLKRWMNDIRATAGHNYYKVEKNRYRWKRKERPISRNGFWEDFKLILIRNQLIFLILYLKFLEVNI